MNVTFLLGNGFDIKLGMKTGYKDFLKWYLDQKPKNDTIRSFQELIQEDIETWADLERTLGQKTTCFPLNDPERFYECKKDLDHHLRIYLRDRYFFPDHDSGSIFLTSLVGFPRFCSSRQSESIREVYDAIARELYLDSCPIRYHVITFNYTNAVDKLWERIPGEYQSVMLWDKEIPIEKGKLLHVHGEIDRDMIVGVNDINQIVNPAVHSPLVEGCCIKPVMNEHCGAGTMGIASGIIEQTDVFVVFGMSIGETDRLWWNMISKCLLEKRDAYMLIVNYDGEYDPVFSYTGRRTEAAFIDKFIRVSGLSEKEAAGVRGKIGVLLNSDMFEMKDYPSTHYAVMEGMDAYRKRKQRKKFMEIFLWVLSAFFVIIGLVTLVFGTGNWMTVFGGTAMAIGGLSACFLLFKLAVME